MATVIEKEQGGGDGLEKRIAQMEQKLLTLEEEIRGAKGRENREDLETIRARLEARLDDLKKMIEARDGGRPVPKTPAAVMDDDNLLGW
jgi:hypothetical protein